MKLFSSILLLFLINITIAQGIDYSFVGKDSTRTSLTCGYETFIKVVPASAPASKVIYSCKNDGVIIRKLNDYILAISVNKRYENIEIEATYDDKTIGHISLNVYCPININVSLFGHLDGESIARNKLKTPLDLKVFELYSDNNYEVESFRLIYVRGGKVISIFCKSTESDILTDAIEQVIGLKAGHKFTIADVKAKIGDKTVPVGGVSLTLK